MKITRSFLGVVLTLCMVLGSMTSTVFATVGDVIYEGELTYEILTEAGSDGTVMVTGGTPFANGALHIPDTISSDGITYKVTEIASDAFKDNIDIAEVRIPQHINKIGRYAFSGCSNLSYLSFAYNVPSMIIGESAFMNCRALTQVTLPDNTTIGSDAFVGNNMYTMQANSAGGNDYTIYGSITVKKDEILAPNTNDVIIVSSDAQIAVEGTICLKYETNSAAEGFINDYIVLGGKGFIENVASDGNIIGAFADSGVEVKVLDPYETIDFTDPSIPSSGAGYAYDRAANTIYFTDDVYIKSRAVFSDGATIAVAENMTARIPGTVTFGNISVAGNGYLIIDEFINSAANITINKGTTVYATEIEANSLNVTGSVTANGVTAHSLDVTGAVDTGLVTMTGGQLKVSGTGQVGIRPNGSVYIARGNEPNVWDNVDFSATRTIVEDSPDTIRVNNEDGSGSYLYLTAYVPPVSQPTGGGGGTIRYTVSYYSGIDEINSVSEKVKRNSKITLPDASVFEVAEDGTMLAGWADRRNGDVKYSIGEEVTVKENMSLYAVWGGSGTGDGKPSLNTEDHILYLQGYPDGTIKPLDNITRAEAAMIYYRLLDDKTREEYRTTEHPFTDVAADHWALEAIATIYNAGMTVGRTETTYEPDADITRAEYALIAARFDSEEYNESLDIFNDTGDHWAKEDIARAAARGWILGYEDGSFKPDAPIIRAEAVTFINRVLKRDPETIDDLLDGMFTFTDNLDITAWYYIDIQEASNDHEYTRKENGTEKWTGLGIGKDR